MIIIMIDIIGTAIMIDKSQYLKERMNTDTEIVIVVNASFSGTEKQQIIEASKDPDFFNKMACSIAPEFYSGEEIKSILALQLFGGVKITTDSGEQLLGNIHIMLIADPGIKVDLLLESMSRLSPNGLFIPDNGCIDIHFSGRITNDHNHEESIMKGAVTIADGGLVCYDNLNRFDGDDRHCLFEVMNCGKNTIESPSRRISLPADTSLLCTIPPKTDRILNGIDIEEQTDLPPFVLSKFSMIIPIRKMPGTYVNMSRKNNNEENDPNSNRYQTAFYSDNFIRKYVTYARLNYNPTIDVLSQEMLEKEYWYLKKKHERISVYQLELLVHLAEASARSRLSETVGEIDIFRSSTIIDCCLDKIENISWKL